MHFDTKNTILEMHLSGSINAIPVAKNQLTFGLLPYNNPVTCIYSMIMPITSTYDYFSLPFFLQCLLGFFSNKFILISTIDVGRYPIIMVDMTD